jgi:hypothetical protein
MNWDTFAPLTYADFRAKLGQFLLQTLMELNMIKDVEKIDAVREHWEKLMQHAATCGRCHPSWSVITLCPIGQNLWFEFKAAQRAIEPKSADSPQEP